MSLSIIVCSTKNNLVEELRKNVAETIDSNSEYEIIIIENVTNPRPLAKVYNEGARKARYENLLFLHQDAGFVSRNWLAQIEEKLKEPDCGVIGFAGAKLMFDFPSSWGGNGIEWMVTYYETDGVLMSLNCPEKDAFTQVVAIDGFAMFVRRNVWELNPFDEEVLNGFHCYDVDFSLSLLPEYKNYVCCNILLYHHSPGYFDKNWATQTMDIYEKKWKNILPCATPDVRLSPTEFVYLEERACFRLIKRLSKMGFSSSVLAKRFLKYPLKPRHLEHLLKYVTYESRRILKL